MSARPVPDDELLTPIQVASMMNLSVATLARWRSDGHPGPRFLKLSNKTIRYRRTDVSSWLTMRNQAA